MLSGKIQSSGDILSDLALWISKIGWFLTKKWIWAKNKGLASWLTLYLLQLPPLAGTRLSAQALTGSWCTHSSAVGARARRHLLALFHSHSLSTDQRGPAQTHPSWSEEQFIARAQFNWFNWFIDLFQIKSLNIILILGLFRSGKQHVYCLKYVHFLY